MLVQLNHSESASGSHETLNSIRVGEASYVSLRVEVPEVYEVLQYGRVNQSLRMVIADMKAEGKIKYLITNKPLIKLE